MFVRTKKIKGKHYAYLVENEWTPWGSRQKVTKYLGRARILQRKETQEYTLPSGYYNTVREAVAQELRNHGFKEQKNRFNHKDIDVDLHTNKVKKKGKNTVIGMNEGFLCDHTLQELINFKPEDNRERAAKRLATTALEAGLKLNAEQMLKLFEEAYK